MVIKSLRYNYVYLKISQKFEDEFLKIKIFKVNFSNSALIKIINTEAKIYTFTNIKRVVCEKIFI